MNRFNAINRQNIASRWARELVGPVTCSTGDGERVDTGVCNKLLGLVRISEHLFVCQLACGTHTVFLSGLSSLERSQTP